MPAPIQDSRVIAWTLGHLTAQRVQDVPLGWWALVLIGGPFDGLTFMVPPQAATGHFVVTLPTTPCDRPGGPCHAHYVVHAQCRRAVYAGIWCLCDLPSAAPVPHPDRN